MIITIIILTIALIGSLFANYNLLKRFEESEEYVENLESWVAKFSKTITEMNTRIAEIDKRGSFSSDDEVGYFFTELKKIISELKSLGNE